VTAPAETPITVGPRDRLRREMRRERELTERILAAHRRLSAERAKKDVAIAAADARIATSAVRLADALIAYTDTAGVRPDRAAVVLGVPKASVVSMIRERRATLRREGLSNR
jgi:hypothetical protein